ncbi:MAG: hypothetical protein P8M32_03310 [Phycisphaerales bacterium]|nr:hypothetical protein [Phycisphaerales bacterium]
MTKTRLIWQMGLLVACLLVTCVLTGASHGQAYCALRDPVRVLYEAYPEADSHRSIIRTVTAADRDAIERDLSLTILYDELGRHTLYVPLREGHPLGLLHVRSERGRYGLTEIAWSLDLEGRITDGRLQRCRDPKLREAFAEDLLSQLGSADVPEILALLQKEGLTSEQRVVLGSAAKTSVVTSIVWDADLLPMRAAVLANTKWPESEAVLHAVQIDRSAFIADTGIEPLSVHAWSVRGVDGQQLGILARSWVNFDGQRVELWWQIDLNGCIVDVSAGDKESSSIKQAFSEVFGKSTATMAECSTAAGVVAGELLHGVGTSVMDGKVD